MRMQFLPEAGLFEEKAEPVAGECQNAENRAEIAVYLEIDDRIRAGDGTKQTQAANRHGGKGAVAHAQNFVEQAQRLGEGLHPGGGEQSHFDGRIFAADAKQRRQRDDETAAAQHFDDRDIAAYRQRMVSVQHTAQQTRRQVENENERAAHIAIERDLRFIRQAHLASGIRRICNASHAAHSNPPPNPAAASQGQPTIERRSKTVAYWSMQYKCPGKT